MVYGFDEFELDAENLELRRRGKLIEGDALVLRLLSYLVSHAGRLITKEELVRDVWDGRAIADNAITVSMARLRKLLSQRRGEREFVSTSYGRGYRFVTPVTVREAASERAHPASILHAATPPFVGRERVLEGLLHAAAEARAGRGRICVLMGEPGIGKTRVVEALERELTGTGMRVAWGYCREAGDTPPLWPWLRVLGEVGASLPPGSIDLALPPSASSESPIDWGSPERHHVFERMLRGVVRAAQQSPWLIVIDDLHRADAASLELMRHMLDEVTRSHVLIVTCLRHTPDRRLRASTHLPQVLGHRNCERIVLGRLREEDVSRYAAAMLDDPNGRFGRALFAKSEGNAFFMAELVRSIAEREHADPAALAVPDAALELVRQRVSRLRDDVRFVLCAAAAIGRSFELPLLAAITERDASSLMISLDDALDAEIVVAAPGSMSEFAFGHELLRAVLYDALSPQERRGWHLRIVEALQERIEHGEAVAASEVAFHAYAALPEGDLRRTVASCRAASAAAAAVYAHSDVVRYARHALETLELMDEPSVRLRMRLLDTISLYARGRKEAVWACREVARLAREQGDGPMLLMAGTKLNLHPGMEAQAGAAAALSDALALLPADQQGYRAIALAGLAHCSPHGFERQQSESLLNDALALAESSNQPTARYAAWATKLYLHGGPEQREQAEQTASDLERLALENPRTMPVAVVGIGLWRAISALQRSDFSAARRSIERASLRCRELRHSELLWHFSRLQALGQLNAGEWAEAVARLQTLHRRAEQHDMVGLDGFCAFDRATCIAELGPIAIDGAALGSRLEYAASDPPSLWAMKLRAASSAGLDTLARASLRMLQPSALAQLPCDRDYLGTLGQLARSALSLRAFDYATAIYPLLARYPDQLSISITGLGEGAVAQLLGMLAHGTGHAARALPHFEAALQINERAGWAVRTLETQLQLARCVLDVGSAEANRRARSLALSAQTRATQLELPRWVSEATSLSSRCA